MDMLDNQLSMMLFQGATGLLNFSHRSAAVDLSLELLQFQNGFPVQIGSYHCSSNQLILTNNLLGEIPNDELNRIYTLYSIPLAVVLITLIVLCIALTTASVCLFFYYRKEQEIKATSRTLSICLFVGCYLLLMSSLFHTITGMSTAQNRS